MALLLSPVAMAGGSGNPPAAKTRTGTGTSPTTGSTGTPTGGQWETWLDGPGDWTQLITDWSTNRRITVGLYAGGSATTSTREQVSSLNSNTIANISSIFAEIGRYLNVNFQVAPFSSLTEEQPLIRIFRSNMGGGNSYAYAYLPGSADSGGDIHLSEAYDQIGSNTNYFTNGRGSHGWQTIYHEIGHALGLDHSFESGTPVPYDNWNYTTMTYTFKGGEPITFMPGDLARLQRVYGVGADDGTGQAASNDTTYAFTDIDSYWDGRYWYGAGGPPAGSGWMRFSGDTIGAYSALTQNLLFDSGGTDTLDLSALTGGGVRVALDTVSGTGSIVYKANYLDTSYRNNGVTGSLSSTGTFLDYGTKIEKVIGTAFSDDFYGVLLAPEVFDGLGQSDNDALYYLGASRSSFALGNESDGAGGQWTTLTYFNVGSNVVDRVRNIERFVFSEGTFALNSTGTDWV